MMLGKVSPLAPPAFPQLTPVPGVELGAVAAGFKYQGRHDLLMVRLAPGTVAAGLFTRNQVTASPVRWCQKALAATSGQARVLVVNAGQANAFTGARGDTLCARVAAMTAELIGCTPDEVLLASTGVIGESITASAFARPLKYLAAGLSETLWRDAARAITTTDTFAKASGRLVDLGNQTVVINGIAKGSGMIAPNMATMLAFVFTNASISADCLKYALGEANRTSFAMATVDSDTSTNDTLLAFATGTVTADHPIEDRTDARMPAFIEGLRHILSDLAQQLVRDGEGAEHFITLEITGAASEEEARTVLMSIANSPLVKTAIAGNDPNWGRILMAAGKADVSFDQKQLQLWLGEQLVASGGSVQRSYDERAAKAHLESREVLIRLDLAMGEAAATGWTSDLTHGYVDINADYRS